MNEKTVKQLKYINFIIRKKEGKFHYTFYGEANYYFFTAIVEQDAVHFTTKDRSFSHSVRKIFNRLYEEYGTIEEE